MYDNVEPNNTLVNTPNKTDGVIEFEEGG